MFAIVQFVIAVFFALSMLVGIGIVAMLTDTPANNVIGFAIMLFAGYALLNQESQDFFRAAWREMDFRWPDL